MLLSEWLAFCHASAKDRGDDIEAHMIQGFIVTQVNARKEVQACLHYMKNAEKLVK